MIEETRKRQLKAIRSREQKLQQDKENALRDLDWRHSSAYPDSCWRWSKEIDGMLFTTSSADEAMSIEEAA